MATEQSSHRQILRSSSIMGGASVANVLMALLRMKIAAVLLGPVGVGLIGLLQNLVSTASTVTALGSSNVGTRQIAKAVGRADQQEIDAARKSLFWGTVFLGSLGSTVFWGLREQIAYTFLGDVTQKELVGWAAIGIFFTVASGSQAALLRGMRRVSDLARVTVFSSACATLFGVPALLVLDGDAALIAFLLVTPISSFFMGLWFALKLPTVHDQPIPIPLLSKQFRVFLKLGFAFMVAGLAAPIGQLIVRSIIQFELSTVELGYFQASWAISMTYIGFVLTAMGADYYPRLTAQIRNPSVANKIVNEQVSVALMLAGPITLGMIALSPLVVELLYSSEFSVASNVLEWQILGDILKLASWPVGFVLLAAGKGRLVLITEFIAMISFVLSVWLLVPIIGVIAAGVGYTFMYIIHLPMMFFIAKSITEFSFEYSVLRDLAVLILSALFIISLSYLDSFLSMTIGGMIACGFALVSFARLSVLASPTSKVGSMTRRLRSILKKKKF